MNVTKAYLLADKTRKSLKIEMSNGNVVISLPTEAPDSICSVIVMEN